GPDALSNPGDIQDNTTGPAYPGALYDYATCAGSRLANGDTGAVTEGDYWWTPTSNNPGPPANGMFVRENADSYYTGGNKTLHLTFGDVADGLSNTLGIGEKHVPLNSLGQSPWDYSCYNGDKSTNYRRAGPGAALAKTNLETSSGIFGSWHTGGVQFAMGDGSVRSIATSIDTATLG